MSFCFVPGCNSGYPSQRRKFKKLGQKMPSLFSCKFQDDLAKWNRAILRADRSFSVKDKVCEMHFDANDIERCFTHKLPDGSIHILKRERPRLRPRSIPTIFPFLPGHFPTKLQKRKAPVKRTAPTKKIKICESDFEREASDRDLKTDKKCSYKFKNVQLKKDDVPSLFQNSQDYQSRKRFKRNDPKKMLTKLENEQLQNNVQQSLKSSAENKDLSLNAVETFLVPINILKKMDLGILHWNKSVVTVLIALYQSEKCLYDKNYKYYYNLHERNKACERIKNVLANMNFICTVQQIRSKINSLRFKYVSEKAYKDRCIKAGQFTEDTYAPAMWCFGLLQFLDDFIKPRTKIEIKAGVMQENQHEIQLSDSNVDYLNIKMEPEEETNMEDMPLRINSTFSLNTSFNESLKDEEITSDCNENKMDSADVLNEGGEVTSVCNENKMDSDDVLNEINSRGMKANIQISASNSLNAIKIFSQESEEKEDIFGEYIASEMETIKDNPLLYMQTKQAIINVLISANFDLLNLE